MRPVGALVRLGARRSGVVIALSVALGLLGLLLLPRLRVELDVLSLLPDTNPKVRAFRDTLEDFGSMDVLLVAFDVAGMEIEEAREFARLVAEELRASGMVAWVQLDDEDLLDAAFELAPHALLFYADDDLEELAGRLDPEGYHDAARLLAERLRLPLAGAQTALLRNDPFALLEPVLDRVDEQVPGGALSTSAGVALSPDGRYLLMVARPLRPSADIAFGSLLVDELAAIEERVGAQFRADWQLEPPPMLTAGGPVIAAWDSRQIQSDVIVGAAVALVAVALLFAIAFGRPLALLFALLPLLLGLILTAFAALLLFGRLNAATSVFAAMLIGLGVDYVILLYGRYVDERHKGCDVTTSIDAMSRRAAPSAAIAALTTSAAMLCLMLSDFRGLAELGGCLPESASCCC